MNVWLEMLIMAIFAKKREENFLGSFLSLGLMSQAMFEAIFARVVSTQILKPTRTKLTWVHV